MNKFQKIACNLARYDLKNNKMFGVRFEKRRNDIYNINMKNRQNIKDAINFKNYIKAELKLVNKYQEGNKINE